MVSLGDGWRGGFGRVGERRKGEQAGVLMCALLKVSSFTIAMLRRQSGGRYIDTRAERHETTVKHAPKSSKAMITLVYSRILNCSWEVVGYHVKRKLSMSVARRYHFIKTRDRESS